MCAATLALAHRGENRRSGPWRDIGSTDLLMLVPDEN
jgi:hypothetical protein